MKNITKNRVGIWLIGLPFFLMCGPLIAIIWTVAQMISFDKEKSNHNMRKVPLRERPHIIEMNKPENLSEHDKCMLRNKDFIKVGEGCYIRAKK